MTDPLAHLQHPAVAVAEAAWGQHVHGTPDRLGCEQCQAAPGPPPPDCPPEQRELYACDEGVRLHEQAVRAAHAALEAPDGR